MSQQPSITSRTYGDLQDAIAAVDVPAYFDLVRACENNGRAPDSFYEELSKIFRRVKKPEEPNRLLALEEQRTEYLVARADQKTEAHLEADRAGVNWFQVCRDLKQPDRALFFLLSGRDREDEVKREIYQPAESRLREFYRDGMGRFYLPETLNFFLRVYNLSEAWQLAKKMRTVSEPRGGAPKPTGRVYAAVIFSLLALVLLLIGTLKIPLFAVASWQGLWHHLTCAWPGVAPDWAQFNGGATALAGAYLAFGIGLLLAFFTRAHIFFRLLLPRLIGGIVVGYMVLIFSNDVWNMIDRIKSPATHFAIIVLAVAFAFFFLLNEVRQTIRHPGVALTRSALILCMGIFYALVIGVVLSDLFGRGMAPAADPGIPGLFGRLFPRFIILSAPLALLIGIFVQIIWEDKPITEPF